MEQKCGTSVYEPGCGLCVLRRRDDSKWGPRANTCMATGNDVAGDLEATPKDCPLSNGPVTFTVRNSDRRTRG